MAGDPTWMAVGLMNVGPKCQIPAYRDMLRMVPYLESSNKNVWIMTTINNLSICGSHASSLEIEAEVGNSVMFRCEINFEDLE